MLAKTKYTWVFIIVIIALINILYANDEANNVIRLDWGNNIPIKNEVLDISDQSNLLYEINLIDPSNKNDIYVHQKTSYEDIKSSSIIKFDNKGNVVGTNMLSNFPDKNEVYKINKVTRTADDGFLIVENSDADLPMNFTIKKIDKSFNEIWHKRFDNKGSLILITALTTVSDGYVVSGYGYDNVENGKSKFCSYKLDENGNLIYNFEHKFDANFMPFNVVQNNKDIIVCGKVYKDNTENIWIADINANGSISWKRWLKDCTILGQSDLLNSANFTVAIDSNKDTSDNKFRILEFDLQGNKVWEKIYTSPYKYDQFKLLCSENKYVLFGRYSELKGYNNEIITIYHAIAIDNVGHVLWEEDVDALKNKKIEDIKAKDNSFLIVGTERDMLSKNDMLWIGKLIVRKYILR